MKRIRFKVWDKINKKWVNNFIINCHGDMFKYNFEKEDYVELNKNNIKLWIFLHHKRSKNMRVNKKGFTTQEELCHSKLMEFLKEYAKLPTQHPSENREVEGAIHTIQGIFAVRVLRREYPKGWKTHKIEGVDK